MHKSCKRPEMKLYEGLDYQKMCCQEFLIMECFNISLFTQVSNSVLYIDSLCFPAVIKHYRKVETSHKYTDI